MRGATLSSDVGWEGHGTAVGEVWPGKLQKCNTRREKLILMPCRRLTPLLCGPSLQGRYSQLQTSLLYRPQQDR
jgi:hypothetical protein